MTIQTGSDDYSAALQNYNIEEDMEFQNFCNRYNINLNDQQNTAVKAVDGANLLIAVPGSGKTTVLVARLGYMILCKNIPANRILAITYTKAAINDMRKRFANYFGSSLAEQIQFSTINSLSLQICRRFFGSKLPETISDEKRKLIIRNILKELMEDYPTDSDVIEAETAITYVKNMMMSVDQIKNLDLSAPDIMELLLKYKNEMKSNNQMDFDDQMLYAFRIFNKQHDILSYYRQRYKYICVDEAQDTSKLQHEIIKLLVSGNNNIFMVGDEDQSIYGFRGAFPQALINFKNDYNNSNVLLMEKNYRSTEEIVRVAASFIDKNTDRHKKNIIAERGHGEEVVRIPAKNRADQYSFLINTLKQGGQKIAVLYRDNDCSIPLIDMLLRNNISYSVKKMSKTFFTHRVVADIKAFLMLAIAPYDTDSFMRIYYKCGLGFNKNTAQWTCDKSRRNHMTVCQTLKEQLKKWDKLFKKAESFERYIERISVMRTLDAIDFIYDKMYKSYMLKNNLDYGKIEIMKSMALSEPTIQGFLERLDDLSELIEKNNSDSNNAVILSTIHSSKGLEYDTVYLLDVYDGLLPSISKGQAMESAELMTQYQEERRLFYVAMTRAMNRLFVFAVENKASSFVDEILPVEKPIPANVTVKKLQPNYLETAIRPPVTSSKVIPNRTEQKSSKVIAESAEINGEIYDIGTIVFNAINGKGTILELSKIINTSIGDYYTAKIKFDNGKIVNYGLDIALANGNIKKIKTEL